MLHKDVSQTQSELDFFAICCKSFISLSRDLSRRTRLLQVSPLSPRLATRRHQHLDNSQSTSYPITKQLPALDWSHLVVNSRQQRERESFCKQAEEREGKNNNNNNNNKAAEFTLIDFELKRSICVL